MNKQIKELSENAKIVLALKCAEYMLHKEFVTQFQFVGYPPIYGDDAEDILYDLRQEYERKELEEE